MRDEAPAADATCPRCGHEQRGVVQSWTHECPVEGVCSECGLAFRWAELLGNERVPSPAEGVVAREVEVPHRLTAERAGVAARGLLGAPDVDDRVDDFLT